MPPASSEFPQIAFSVDFTKFPSIRQSIRRGRESTNAARFSGGPYSRLDRECERRSKLEAQESDSSRRMPRFVGFGRFTRFRLRKTALDSASSRRLGSRDCQNEIIRDLGRRRAASSGPDDERAERTARHAEPTASLIICIEIKQRAGDARRRRTNEGGWAMRTQEKQSRLGSPLGTNHSAI
jgi:hypothetical protein